MKINGRASMWHIKDATWNTHIPSQSVLPLNHSLFSLSTCTSETPGSETQLGSKCRLPIWNVGLLGRMLTAMSNAHSELKLLMNSVFTRTRNQDKQPGTQYREDYSNTMLCEVFSQVSPLRNLNPIHGEPQLDYIKTIWSTMEFKKEEMQVQILA